MNQEDKMKYGETISNEKKYEALQESLDFKAHQYLNLIFENYGEYFQKEQLELLKELQNKQIISVEKDATKYKEINGQDAIVPLAHGGRVYNDNVIHFYPFTVKEENQNRLCEETLIHELFHYFIRPEYLNSEQKYINEGNSFLTEGLVDMCARDIQKKYQLYPDYNSNYGSNVLYVREALNNIPNKTEQMTLVFQGSIKDFYEKTSTQQYNSVENMIDSKNRKTAFDKELSDISNYLGTDENKKNSFLRFLYNYSANFETKEKAMNSIEVELQKRNIHIQKESPELEHEKTFTLKSKNNHGIIDVLYLSIFTIIWSVLLLAYVYFSIQ